MYPVASNYHVEIGEMACNFDVELIHLESYLCYQAWPITFLGT